MKPDEEEVAAQLLASAATRAAIKSGAPTLKADALEVSIKKETKNDTAEAVARELGNTRRASRRTRRFR